MSRMLISCTVLLCLPATLTGQSSPELDKPYHLRVVVEMPTAAEFTPLYRERVCREIGECLKAALGNIGDVEVVTRASLNSVLQTNDASNGRRVSLQRTLDLLSKVDEKGLKQALDEWREISDLKTHFVILDLVDGRYEIQARQFDGSTGLPSPVVRQTRTNDRELVGRTAALLAAQDFGVIGSVAAGSPGPEVQLSLQAGKLGPMTQWVGKGDVFAIAALGGSGGNMHSRRVREALLQVVDEPKDGVCRCRLLHRYQDPLAAGSTYRCLKLGTTEALLTLRLIDEKGRPLGGRRLKVSPGEPGRGPDDLATASDGFTRPLGPYRHLALVTVLDQGDKPLTGQIPIEILGDRPVVCQVRVDPEAEKAGQFEYERTRLQHRLDESLLAVAGLVTELNQSSKDPKVREVVMRRARSGLENLAKELGGYREEVARLANTKKVRVEPLRERIQILEKRQEDFRAYITKLEKVVKEETDPKLRQLKELWLKADGLEQEAKFDEAIAAYDEFLQSGIQKPEHQKHVNELKEAWALKNDDTHPKARKFVYEVWPKLETPKELRDHMAQAKTALETFIKMGDRLSPLMLLKANIVHATKLARRQEVIERSEADQQESQAIVDLTPELVELTKRTQTFLKIKDAAKK